MYVTENARRRGCATSLLTFLETEFRARGIKKIKLVTGINNETAAATYSKRELDDHHSLDEETL
ncbi:putative acetyltransferase [compost metagenome]